MMDSLESVNLDRVREHARRSSNSSTDMKVYIETKYSTSKRWEADASVHIVQKIPLAHLRYLWSLECPYWEQFYNLLLPNSTNTVSPYANRGFPADVSSLIETYVVQYRAEGVKHFPTHLSLDEFIELYHLANGPLSLTEIEAITENDRSPQNIKLTADPKANYSYATTFENLLKYCLELRKSPQVTFNRLKFKSLKEICATKIVKHKIPQETLPTDLQEYLNKQVQKPSLDVRLVVFFQKRSAFSF